MFLVSNIEGGVMNVISKLLCQIACFTVIASSTAFVGCGADEGSKMIQPEMSAEEIQAKADSKSDEVVDPT
ncbi:hypothetical protein RSSM_06535 [Rhodopirellula sallentina SM41]|uniref:Uncharacterized protein n=1 Tax=Rhodopirellula sallentina SM41 TaxID=1263870 RepID=M5TSI6_9BACT|nr:hypothetical protein RSSM_06535 [Rhodopirellula sallentina SM41]